MTVRILEGDVRDRLAELPDQSVQTCVTSPPYYGLRDYGTAGQLGLEPTLAEYIATMVEVFREVRRVLRDDGTLWLNIGDSYNAYNANRGRSNGISGNADVARPVFGGAEGDLLRPNPGGGEVVPQHRGRSGTGSGGPGLHELERGLTEPRLKPKDLMMVPARLAIALQDDGWYLRSDIIWFKKNPMPESVTDRPTSSHEHIFLLTKRSRYYYDADAIREAPATYERKGGTATWTADGVHTNGIGSSTFHQMSEAGANCRNVWTIATKPFSEAHFATFPPEIPTRCIKAGTSEKGQCPACGAPWVRVVERGELQGEAVIQSGGRPAADVRGVSATSLLRTNGRTFRESTTTGWQPSCTCDAGEPVPQTVLDPFLGSGTTLLVADRLGRHGVGIELNAEYAQMARKRITNDCPLFTEVA